MSEIQVEIKAGDPAVGRLEAENRRLRERLNAVQVERDEVQKRVKWLEALLDGYSSEEAKAPLAASET